MPHTPVFCFYFLQLGEQQQQKRFFQKQIGIRRETIRCGVGEKSHNIEQE